MPRKPKPTDERPIAYPDLPPGWEVREYTNRYGRKSYACYVDGKRVAYGQVYPQGAVRAAKRLVAPTG